MTDNLAHPPIADACARFEERLMAYLERELVASDRDWMEAHRSTCTACDTTVRELEALTTQAGALPGLAPSRDLWSGIAEHIDTPVVALPLVAAAAPPTRARPSRGPSVRWFAVAATLLVAVSSAVTWRIARSRNDAPTVATSSGAPSADTGNGNGATVIPVANADVVYEQEITALRTIVNDRFRELDTSTVKVLRRNLEIIDQAINESRAALAKDPNSRVLSTSLDRALASKLTLMRRVALL
jgi:hypothetical protein